jgi:NTP pyrophosphatase (non-canonical NTP hydrolase)
MTNTEKANMDLPLEIERNTRWHYDKDIIENGVEERQLDKLIEEAYEVREAMFQELSDDEVKKEIGDVVTVLNNLCERRGYTLQECLELTNEKLSKRTGKKINGTFVKSEDL